MAEETLVGAQLSPEMIASGKELLKQLDSKMTVDAALWLLPPDSHAWRLVIASPEVRLSGPRAVYKKVLGLLKRVAPSSLSLKDISVVDTSDPLIALFRAAIRTEHGAQDIRFTRNTISGVFVPDAFIYRLA